MLSKVDEKQEKGNERMIEISVQGILEFLGFMLAFGCCIFLWVVVWTFLAFAFEYPKNPSWRTAVPAALPFLILLLTMLKVIVFV